MKSKVAPTGQCNYQPPEREKQVSFKADGSTHEQSSPPNDDGKSLPREWVMAKTGSCPARMFPNEAKTPQQRITHVDGLNTTSSSNKTPGSRRRRAQSMPVGSLASHDFFGGTNNYAAAGASSRNKLEKLSENRVLRDDGKHCLNGSLSVKEHYSMDLKKMNSSNAKKRAAYGTTLKRETQETQQKYISAKCHCILL